MQVMQPKAKVASWADRADPLLSTPEKRSLNAKGESQHLQEDDQQDLTDMEWMRQRMRGVGDTADLEQAFEQQENDEQDNETSEKKDPTEETILRTARLFVRNLTFTCMEEELRQLFQPFGVVSQVRLYPLRWIELSSRWGVVV